MPRQSSLEIVGLELSQEPCQPPGQEPCQSAGYRGLCGSCRHTRHSRQHTFCRMPGRGADAFCNDENKNGSCERWQATRWRTLTLWLHAFLGGA